MRLLIMAAEGDLPNTKLSITADTGSEKDCLWSTGDRTTAKEYISSDKEGSKKIQTTAVIV
jgi:hypothetical protein